MDQQQETTLDSLMHRCIDSIAAYVKTVDEHLQSVDREPLAADLRQTVRDLCAANFATKRKLACAREVETDYRRAAEPARFDVEAAFAAKLAERPAEEDAETHAFWQQIYPAAGNASFSEVQEVSVRETANVVASYSFTDDSFVCSSSIFKPPIDPITKTVIVDPYKSSSCGHVYERKSIMKYITMLKNRAKCPYIGCANKNLTASSLLPDEDTKRKTQEYQSQHPDSNSDSDGDD